MTKKTLNSEPAAVTTDGLTSLVEEVVFHATPSMRVIKSRFWHRYLEAGLNQQITASLITQLTGDKKVERWWGFSGFKSWFLNQAEHQERLEYLFSLALDTAEQILQDQDAQPSARVNMVKAIAELANKMPNRYAKERFTDDDINKMTEPELRKYLERKGIKYLAQATDIKEPDSEQS